MKIIISENQELDVKKKFIFMLLNNRNYALFEVENTRIYFVKDINSRNSEIRCDKEDYWCGISHHLITFFSKITGFRESEVKELIGIWVEHVLDVEIEKTSYFLPTNPLRNI